jgi:hypothetical protein
MPRTKSLEDSCRANDTYPNPVRVVDYQPGNGTRYHLVFVGPYVPTFATEKLDLAGCYTVTHLVDGKGRTMTVANTGTYLSMDYVAEKLGLSSTEDAKVLAEVIAHFTGRRADTAAL